MYNTLKVARELGEKFYMSQKECLRGHRSKRYVKTSQCFECMIEKSRTPEAKAANRINGQNRSIRLRALRLANPQPKKITTRQIAKDNKEATYRSGKDCRHNHTDPIRSTNSGYCLECEKINRQQRNPSVARTPKPKKVKIKQSIIITKAPKEETFDEMAKRLYKENHKW